MKKYRKFGYKGLAEVYVKARKEGYSRTYDSMCKIIKKIKGNAKEKLKKQLGFDIKKVQTDNGK